MTATIFWPRAALFATVAAIAPLALAGCSPTVKVEAPDKPIEINLNIKIEQEIRVKVERDIEQLLDSEPGLF